MEGGGLKREGDGDGEDGSKVREYKRRRNGETEEDRSRENAGDLWTASPTISSLPMGCGVEQQGDAEESLDLEEGNDPLHPEKMKDDELPELEDDAQDLVNNLPLDLSGLSRNKDLVSNLPLDLSSNIFYRLSTLDFMGKSGVCRQWREIWLATPVNLNYGQLGIVGDDDKRRAFIIDCILRTHPGPIHRVEFSNICLTPNIIANFRLWFSDPSFDRLDELCLSFREVPPRRHLPGNALRFTTVRVIAMSYCVMPSHIEFSSTRLSVLKLYRVLVSSKTLNHILSQSHLLTTLRLVRSNGFQKLYLKLRMLRELFVLSFKDELATIAINEAASLEHIYLNHFAQGPEVVISNAPKLQTLGYIGLEIPRLQIGSLIMRQSSAVNMAGYCPSVTTLAIKMLFPDLPYLGDFLNFFPNLQTLHILFVDRSNLDYPSERSAGQSSLTNMQLPINCLEHTLRHVVFWYFPDGEPSVELAKFFIERASVLESLVFATEDWQWPAWAEILASRMNTRHLASPHAHFYFASFKPCGSQLELGMIKDDPFRLPVKVYMNFPAHVPDAAHHGNGDDDNDDDDDQDRHDDGDADSTGASVEKENVYRGSSLKDPDKRGKGSNSQSSLSHGAGAKQSGSKTCSRLELHCPSILIRQDVSTVMQIILEKLFDTYPNLEKVVVPLGGTLCGTMMAWLVMPIILRRLHKYPSKSHIAALLGKSTKNDVSYQTSLWCALEEPAKYLITFMAFSEMATLIAPSISTYLPQAWRGAFVLSFVWFLQRWKTNFIAKAVTNPDASSVDRERISAFDKVSSLGLIGLGVMGLAEACGLAVQSILTVGGVGESSDGATGDGGGGSWIKILDNARKSTVDATTDTGKKLKELTDAVTPHVQQLFDTYPNLEKVVVALGGTLCGTMMAWLVMHIILRRLHKYASKSPIAALLGKSTKNDVSYQTSLWCALEDPAKYLITFMAFSEMATLIAPSIPTYLPQAWRGAFVLSFVWFLQRWKTNFIAKAVTNPDASSVDRERISAFDKVSSLGLIGLGVMGLAEACGLAVQSILTVGGVGGVATAFAARDILGNILSGFSLQFSKPFSVNDYIKAGPIEGKVVEIGLTSTSLINPEKLPVIVPNSLFSSQMIVNRSRANWRASVTKIPIRIEDIEKIPSSAEEIKVMLRSNPNVSFDSDVPYCYLSRLESSYGELTIGCNLKNMRKDEWLSTEQDILLGAARIIKSHGIELGSTMQCC